MSAQGQTTLRITAVVAIMVGALGYLAYTGIQESKSYYVTISELRRDAGQNDAIYKKRLRVAGNVVPGSIRRQGTHAEFMLTEQGQTLAVIYNGSEPPPDTFKDDAQALAEGQLGRDGVFHARTLEAKCASKYAPAKPSTQASN